MQLVQASTTLDLNLIQLSIVYYGLKDVGEQVVDQSEDLHFNTSSAPR